MVVRDITEFLENFAPKGAAWESDNPGLQVGNPNEKVSNITLALNPTLEVLHFAHDKSSNLIITHHPLFFKPIKALTPDIHQKYELVKYLLNHNISLYSAHTNLDFAKNGVSFALAEKISLQNIDFLIGLKDTKFKIIVFVPEEKVDEVAEAIFKAGGGIIGNYSKCSFRLKGEGTFLGSEDSNPAIGEKGVFEKAPEVKLEVLVDKWNIDKVINAIKKSHPYEEPAYDMYPNSILNRNFGYGAIGYLPEKMKLNDFLDFVTSKLNLKNFRYVPGDKDLIEKVAVCGGSGSDLVEIAYKQKADAFITADIKYHSFLDFRNKMTLIDAGHFETEFPILEKLKAKIENFLSLNSDNKIEVFIYYNENDKIEFYK